MNFKQCNKFNFTSGRTKPIEFIVIHYTANNGDTAKNNADYFARDRAGASAHYFVDEKEVWQSVKDSDTAWHCGGGVQGSKGKTFYNVCMNSNSIGIELCSRRGHNNKFYFKDETIDNAVELTRMLMEKYNIPLTKVIRHFDVTGKECPKPFVEDEMAWINFKNRLEQSEVFDVAQTVMRLDNIWVQEIFPDDFSIVQCDVSKRKVNLPNYFNLGFFTELKGGKTIPVGNLAIDGKVITQACDNEDWINLHKKSLSTILIDRANQITFAKTDRLDSFKGLKFAVSGIPIIKNSHRTTMEDVKAEGYFGNELYNTWHGILGIRHNKLVYVAMQCGFDSMVWNLVALGIYDAIKLDGGGSFILHNGKEMVGTSENRRINNVGVWTK